LMTVIVITLAVILVSDDNEDTNILLPSSSESPAPTPTPTASMESPKPELIIEEVKDYNYWFNRLDPENRVLAVYDECGYLVPSNVTYKNNTLVMLDNTRSQQTHILKIGKTEYSLAAGAWNTVTLSSPTLPAKMQIFCKGIELGQIDLE